MSESNKDRTELNVRAADASEENRLPGHDLATRDLAELVLCSLLTVHRHCLWPCWRHAIEYREQG